MTRAITIIALLVAGVPAVAGTYHVATSGADTNPGTLDAPFRTIQKAASVVQPGDEVVVGAGTYTDEDGDGYVVALNRGGSANAWITFRSEARWGAVIDGAHDTATHCWLMGAAASYVRIEGFEIRDCADAGFHSNSGAHDVWFGHNHVHDIGRICTDTQYGKTGIFQGTGSANHTYAGNVIHDIGRLAPGEQGCQPSTTYYRNHDHALYLDASHITVVNNVLYNNQRGWDIQIYGSAQKDDIRIVNNTFAFASPYRDGHITIGPGTSNVLVENNVFYQPRTAMITVDSCTGIQAVTLRANISDVAMLQSGPADCHFAATDNLVSTDPELRAPASLDLHLGAASPAIDRGVAGDAPADDLDGTARPQGAGVDLGAYEYTTASGDAGIDPGDGGTGDDGGAAPARHDGCAATGPSPTLLLVAGILALSRRRAPHRDRTRRPRP